MNIAAKRESLDTNVLARLVLRDVPEHYEAAKKLICTKGRRFYVSDTAIQELVYALGAHYAFTRDQAAEVVSSLLTIESIDCNRALTTSALELYTGHDKLSYADCYLAASASDMNALPLWTFDKDLAQKVPSAQLLA
ncbi:MAG: PIN domain-containing protein [Coriobacteriia bacterium]|nr:PIN domain-containing protein [Coriobacteriia bacterium]MCL2537297.1 PIN domain-containing protein [Coriobacteriia bacterium]